MGVAEDGCIDAAVAHGLVPTAGFLADIGAGSSEMGELENGFGTIWAFLGSWCC